MGKANRIRREHAEEILRLQQQKKKNSLPGWALATIISAVGVIAAAAIVLCVLSLNGTFLRTTVSAEGVSNTTDQTYEVDNAMMAYFFMTGYSEYVNKYAYYLSYLGLDTTKSLKSQPCYDGKQSWFAYFAEDAETEVRELVTTAMAAKAAGYDDSENVNRYVDRAIEAIHGYAEKNGMSFSKYLSKCYGTGIKEEDVRRALTLYYTAQSYYNYLTGNYSFSDADVDARYNENPKEFQYVDYLYYSFSVTTEDGATDAEKTKAKDDAKARAEHVAEATTPDEFRALMADYFRQTATSELNDTELKSKIDALYNEAKTYAESEVNDWLFDAARVAGETYVSASDTAAAVYMVVNPAIRHEYNTVSARHILLMTESTTDDKGETQTNVEEVKKEAEKILAEYEKNPGAESFAKLVEEYSEDTGSVLTGGLYTNIDKGDMVASFNDWIFDPARKPGDTGIIESTYGVHIMYFEEVSDPAWKAAVKAALKSEKYTEDYKEFQLVFSVNFDDAKIARLPF